MPVTTVCPSTRTLCLLLEMSHLMSIKSSFQTFWYNFRWSEWVAYIDGWIPRFAFFVPLLGYLILFNDEITEIMHFQQLAGSSDLYKGLESGERLRLVYFGLIFLGVSNVIYRLKKPHIFRFGSNIREYTSNCLQTLTFGDFQRMHFGIREDGHLTQNGKYYDSEWDGFKKQVLNEGEGTDEVAITGHWENAKLMYGSLLRSILNEHFFKKDVARKGWLMTCLIISSLGYLLLVAPSLDLFIKVMVSTFML